jgi:hypothetical protein
MASIDSKELIDDLMQHGGRMASEQDDAPDNPRAIKIVEYHTPEGGTCYGVIFEGDRADHNRYEVESAYVLRPKVIWRYEGAV